MEIGIEVIINKLEYKVNELTIRNAKLEKLRRIKDSLEATYRCELRKELLQLSLNNTNARGNGKIAQLRLNRDLAKIRYYLMKSSIENIKFEIEVLRSMLIWLRVEFSVLKGELCNQSSGQLALILKRISIKLLFFRFVFCDRCCPD